MADEARPRPFHERFDIEVGAEEAQRRFMNRATNDIFDSIYKGTLGGERLTTYGVLPSVVSRHIANALGERYAGEHNLEIYVKKDFGRCLQVLEALYKVLKGTFFEEDITAAIRNLINASEVDLGIRWQPPIFVRAGAPLLDEHLVNEPLSWLAEPKYKSVRQPFEKGLSHYLEAQNRPARLADVITDMYEAVEALAKIVTGRTIKDLSANAEQFISKVKASQHYRTLLKGYIAYANEYRHAEAQGKPRPVIKEPEVESFIYLTGLFIRLAIRTT